MAENIPKTGTQEEPNENALPATGPGGVPSLVPYVPDPMATVTQALGALRDEQAELQNMIDQPQEMFQLPVPQDQSINLITKIGAALSNIGGDSQLFRGLLAEKQQIAGEQREVQGRNMILAARQKQDQQSALIANLGSVADNLLQQAELESTMAEFNDPKDMTFKTVGAAQEYLESAVSSGQITDPVASYNRNASVRSAIDSGGYDSTEAGLSAVASMISKREAKDSRAAGTTGLLSPARWVQQFGEGFEADLATITPGGTQDEDGNLIPFPQEEFDQALEDIALKLSNLDPESTNYQQYAESLYRRFGEAAVSGQSFLDEAAKAAAAAEVAAEVKARTEEFRGSFASKPGLSLPTLGEAVLGAPELRGRGDKLTDILGISSAIESIGAGLDAFWEANISSPDATPLVAPGEGTPISRPRA